MTTAADLLTQTIDRMDLLVRSKKFRSRRATHLHLAELSGVSLTLIQELHNGKRDTTSIKHLDRLSAAVDAEYRKHQRRQPRKAEPAA